MKTTKEKMKMWDMAWEMWEDGKIDTETCEGCPFKEECKMNEWYWGCGVWENAMGEDL